MSSLIYKVNSSRLAHTPSRALQFGRWRSFLPAAGWQTYADTYSYEYRPLDLPTLINAVTNSVNSTFQPTPYEPNAFLGASIIRGTRYDSAYDSYCAQLAFSMPPEVATGTYRRMVLEFYDGGATGAVLAKRSPSYIIQDLGWWRNLPAQDILYGASLTASRPPTPASAGSPHFNISINQMTDIAVSGGASISGSIGQYPYPYNSSLPLSLEVTGGLLQSLQGQANIFLTVKPISVPAFWLPQNIGDWLLQGLSTGFATLWVYQ